MADTNITFERSIGRKLSAAESRRRDILLKAIPKIEEYYTTLSRRKLTELDAMPPKARKAALDLYNKVVADGRYVDLLRTDPAAAAKKVGAKIDPDDWRVIQSVADKIRNPGGPVEGPTEAVIAVVVVIACAKPSEGVVIDESAMVQAKL
jgi:hypothetical protein